ncbi:MAG: Signal transduction histidine kinase [Capsulimonas sp.]|nr:Signal transduction histidine kinase [Capsulimonas sp.]
MPGSRASLRCINRDLGRDWPNTENSHIEEKSNQKRVRRRVDRVGWVEISPGQTEHVTGPLRELTGYAASDMRGVEWLFSRVRRRDVATLRRAFVKLQHEGRAWDEDLRFRRADGRWIWLNCRAKKLTSKHLRGLISVNLSDVTHRKAREEAVLRNKTTVGEGAAIEEWLANLTHELRAPLTGILGYTELLMTCDDESIADRDRWIRTIDSSGRRLLSLVNNVLKMSRLESGAAGVDVETFNPNEVVTECVAQLAPLARRKALRIDIVSDMPADVLVRADASKFYQIINNLIGNAIKFTDTGRVVVKLQIVRVSKGEELFVDVTDTGAGIESADQARVFDLYQRGRSASSKQIEGTGLGLSISRKLARLMGGDLTCRSAPGAGSTFTVRIPIQCADHDAFEIISARRD